MLDKSGSMDTKDDGKKSRWQNLLEQCWAFLNLRQQSESDVISIIFYESKAILAAECISIAEAFKIIDKAGKAGGGTNFLFALQEFVRLLEK